MCFATAILTNVGDPTRRFGTSFARSSEGLVIGDVILRRLVAMPPLRPLTRAAFSVTNQGSTLLIGLKLDPSCFSPLDAEELLGQYVSQLYSTAQSVRTRAVPATLAR
jgi:hypothetical protein